MNLQTLALDHLSTYHFSKLICRLGIFFIFCFSISSAHAFDLNFNTSNTTTKNQSNYYDNSIKKISSLIVFDEADLSDAIEVLKNEYLTFYSTKNEKLRATYSSGMYYVKYTHKW